MSETGFDVAGWRRELEDHRRRKDEFLAEHPQSPLPKGDRETFDGLDYFEPDPAYRVEATIEPVSDTDTVEVERTAGDAVEYDRVARLHFDIGGGEYTLGAYRTGEDGGLFVPFRDATSGRETYGAGRYMEFEVDGELADGGAVALDFNLAYSPFCAYNDAFTCPLPPAENRLDVRIEAGERYDGDTFESAH